MGFSPRGEVSERFKEHAWKACVGETQPWVQIPPSPPYLYKPHPLVLFPSVLHNATFCVAIVEPCTALQRGNEWEFKLSITGKRSREPAGDIDRSRWVAALKR